jgi:hypothetical protein
MHRMMIAAAMVMALGAHGAAQDWPARPITLVVPFAAGGGVDVSARIQAQRMDELLGQSVVVENVAAAAGMVDGALVSPSAAAPSVALFRHGRGHGVDDGNRSLGRRNAACRKPVMPASAGSEHGRIRIASNRTERGA